MRSIPSVLGVPALITNTDNKPNKSYQKTGRSFSKTQTDSKNTTPLLPNLQRQNRKDKPKNFRVGESNPVLLRTKSLW